jgi:putative oxidoreductase
MIVILVVVMIPRGTGFQLSTVWIGVFAYQRPWDRTLGAGPAD